ncbi:AP2 domain transcription factor AP2VI-3 [Besnoitia besnoiti]|uniref:AP2 domain transcription factor AP2VI-3 n=1 Tax=Besnoitia besnoiti TaxID=94643 RepID=A0A2A9M334_BESBE|nr:AP2 domain transcription factor AP2VI-3 [Besnoitia besnoiti]PFH32898.1 AP2 domain transcription factor AP2VI-3 [Besnoitia besnoiti]
MPPQTLSDPLAGVSSRCGGHPWPLRAEAEAAPLREERGLLNLVAETPSDSRSELHSDPVALRGLWSSGLPTSCCKASGSAFSSSPMMPLALPSRSTSGSSDMTASTSVSSRASQVSTYEGATSPPSESASACPPHDEAAIQAVSSSPASVCVPFEFRTPVAAFSACTDLPLSQGAPGPPGKTEKSHQLGPLFTTPPPLKQLTTADPRKTAPSAFACVTSADAGYAIPPALGGGTETARELHDGLLRLDFLSPSQRLRIPLQMPKSCSGCCLPSTSGLAACAESCSTPNALSSAFRWGPERYYYPEQCTPTVAGTPGPEESLQFAGGRMEPIGLLEEHSCVSPFGGGKFSHADLYHDSVSLGAVANSQRRTTAGSEGERTPRGYHPGGVSLGRDVHRLRLFADPQEPDKDEQYPVPGGARGPSGRGRGVSLDGGDSLCNPYQELQKLTEGSPLYERGGTFPPFLRVSEPDRPETPYTYCPFDSPTSWTALTASPRKRHSRSISPSTWDGLSIPLSASDVFYQDMSLPSAGRSPRSPLVGRGGLTLPESCAHGEEPSTRLAPIRSSGLAGDSDSTARAHAPQRGIEEGLPLGVSQAAAQASEAPQPSTSHTQAATPVTEVVQGAEKNVFAPAASGVQASPVQSCAGDSPAVQGDAYSNVQQLQVKHETAASSSLPPIFREGPPPSSVHSGHDPLQATSTGVKEAKAEATSLPLVAAPAGTTSHRAASTECCASRESAEAQNDDGGAQHTLKASVSPSAAFNLVRCFLAIPHSDLTHATASASSACLAGVMDSVPTPTTASHCSPTACSSVSSESGKTAPTPFFPSRKESPCLACGNSSSSCSCAPPTGLASSRVGTDNTSSLSAASLCTSPSSSGGLEASALSLNKALSSGEEESTRARVQPAHYVARASPPSLSSGSAAIWNLAQGLQEGDSSNAASTSGLRLYANSSLSVSAAPQHLTTTVAQAIPPCPREEFAARSVSYAPSGSAGDGHVPTQAAVLQHLLPQIAKTTPVTANMWAASEPTAPQALAASSQFCPPRAFANGPASSASLLAVAGASGIDCNNLVRYPYLCPPISYIGRAAAVRAFGSASCLVNEEVPTFDEHEPAETQQESTFDFGGPTAVPIRTRKGFRKPLPLPQEMLACPGEIGDTERGNEPVLQYDAASREWRYVMHASCSREGTVSSQQSAFRAPPSTQDNVRDHQGSLVALRVFAASALRLFRVFWVEDRLARYKVFQAKKFGKERAQQLAEDWYHRARAGHVSVGSRSLRGVQGQGAPKAKKLKTES